MEEIEPNIVIPGLSLILGEGPHWDIETQSLYFLDIEGSVIYNYCPKDNNLTFVKVPNNPGCVAPLHNSNNLMAATTVGFEIVDWGKNQLATTTLWLDRKSMEPDAKNNRFNDGKVDPRGRFWAGTMDRHVPTAVTTGNGYLFCVDPDKSFTTKKNNVKISNGLAWTRDGKKMYYIDSPTQKIISFDIDEHGETSNEQDAIVFPKDWVGTPDGMTIDSEDHLWIAFWGGSKVVRFDPKTGTQKQVINLPCPNITSCCFGGPNLDKLFITSSKMDTDVKTFPLAGSLFFRKYLCYHWDCNGKI